MSNNRFSKMVWGLPYRFLHHRWDQIWVSNKRQKSNEIQQLRYGSIQNLISYTNLIPNASDFLQIRMRLRANFFSVYIHLSIPEDSVIISNCIKCKKTCCPCGPEVAYSIPDMGASILYPTPVLVFLRFDQNSMFQLQDRSRNIHNSRQALCFFRGVVFLEAIVTFYFVESCQQFSERFGQQYETCVKRCETVLANMSSSDSICRKVLTHTLKTTPRKLNAPFKHIKTIPKHLTHAC